MTSPNKLSQDSIIKFYENWKNNGKIVCRNSKTGSLERIEDADF